MKGCLSYDIISIRPFLPFFIHVSKYNSLSWHFSYVKVILCMYFGKLFQIFLFSFVQS